MIEMAFNSEHLAKSKDSDERYTPRWVFDKLGAHFDLDVAAPPNGNPNVPCTNYFTAEIDALKQTWMGFIWMNPPYSKPKPWIERFIQHSNGIALLPTSHGKWWLDLWYHPGTMFVPMPPMKFDTPNGTMTTTAPWRSWLVGIGNQAEQALKRFEQ